ncbi:hypothetical protein AX16_010325 [Volvariella volvacea WC 439]|nr:hypothetical protein AX16_010325 [Volvariella volvacea WC 439]
MGQARMEFHAMDSHDRVVHPTPIKEWDGNRSHFRKWFGAVKMAMVLYPNDVQKIYVALFHLSQQEKCQVYTEPRIHQFTQWIEDQMNIVPCPWSGAAAMYEEALQHFGSLNEQVNVEVELRKIKMKAGESVAEFNLWWDLVVKPSDWTEKALVALYRDVLTDEIFDLCTNSDPIPITLEEWRSKADWMDWAKRTNMARNFNRRQNQHTMTQPRPQGTSVIPTQRLEGMAQALSQLPRAPQWQSLPPQQQRQPAQGYTPPKHDIKTPLGTTFGG